MAETVVKDRGEKERADELLLLQRAQQKEQKEIDKENSDKIKAAKEKEQL